MLIDYPDSFNIHDKANTIALLKTAKEVMPNNSKLIAEIDNMLADALIKDEDLLAEVKASTQEGGATTLTHTPVTTADDLVTHMMEMIQSGMSKQEILATHPEISALFNTQGEENGEND